VLGAELGEGGEGFVDAVQRSFVVGDFKVRCALRDQLYEVSGLLCCTVLWCGGG
jgi:hypothetical protein